MSMVPATDQVSPLGAPAAELRMLPCGEIEKATVCLDNEIIEVHCGATIGDEHQNEVAPKYQLLKTLRALQMV